MEMETKVLECMKPTENFDAGTPESPNGGEDRR